MFMDSDLLSNNAHLLLFLILSAPLFWRVPVNLCVWLIYSHVDWNQRVHMTWVGIGSLLEWYCKRKVAMKSYDWTTKMHLNIGSDHGTGCYVCTELKVETPHCLHRRDCSVQAFRQHDRWMWTTVPTKTILFNLWNLCTSEMAKKVRKKSWMHTRAKGDFNDTKGDSLVSASRILDLCSPAHIHTVKTITWHNNHSRQTRERWDQRFPEVPGFVFTEKGLTYVAVLTLDNCLYTRRHACAF